MQIFFHLILHPFYLNILFRSGIETELRRTQYSKSLKISMIVRIAKREFDFNRSKKAVFPLNFSRMANIYGFIYYVVSQKFRSATVGRVTTVPQVSFPFCRSLILWWYPLLYFLDNKSRSFWLSCFPYKWWLSNPVMIFDKLY